MKQANRWTYDIELSAEDKTRLRGFVRNETMYYNALLSAFSSRARTMPKVLEALNDECIMETARKAVALRESKSLLSEDELLIYDVVAKPAVLHPDIRAAMAREMLRAHRQIAAALHNSMGSSTDAYRSPIQTLIEHDGKLKRHVQLPQQAVRIDYETDRLSTVYTKGSIKVLGDIPSEKNWNLVVIRETDLGRGWNIDFREEPAGYDLRIYDAPSNRKIMPSSRYGEKRS